MDRLQNSRRFAMTLASLGLLAIPFGCGSETPMAEVPAPPSAVADSHVEFVPTPMPGTAPGAVEPPAAVDPSLRQAAGEMKHEANRDAAEARKEVRDAEGDVKKAASDAEGEAKAKAQAIEAEARRAAEEALDKLLPGPK